MVDARFLVQNKSTIPELKHAQGLRSNSTASMQRPMQLRNGTLHHKLPDAGLPLFGWPALRLIQEYSRKGDGVKGVEQCDVMARGQGTRGAEQPLKGKS